MRLQVSRISIAPSRPRWSEQRFAICARIFGDYSEPAAKHGARGQRRQEDLHQQADGAHSI
jgi:hypothetical protein